NEFEKAQSAYNETQGAVKSAAAALKMAALNHQFTKVTAPISGRISRRLVDPGNIVTGNETPLATIVSLDPMHAYFDIDERTFLRIQTYLDQTGVHPDKRRPVLVRMGLASDKD